MRLASQQSQRSFREAGLQPMPAAEALDALGRLLAGARAQACVARIDWSVLKPLHEARRARPFLSRLGVSPAGMAAAPAAGPAAAGLLERIAGLPQARREEMLVEFVSQEVAAVLALDAAQHVPLDTGLFDMGMDSLMSVELKRRLERGAGQALPSTLTFNYPNVGALARFLESRLAAPAAPAPVIAAVEPPAPPATADADLDALSDDELEARLLARLEQLG
jgi:acyl carrier protein